MEKNYELKLNYGMASVSCWLAVLLCVLIYLNVPAIFHCTVVRVVRRSHLSPQEIQPMVARHEVDRRCG